MGPAVATGVRSDSRCQTANAPPSPAVPWRPLRAGLCIHFQSAPVRERSAARALVRNAAPVACFPRPGCEAGQDTPEHLARVPPRASDVGARALAALHRGVLPGRQSPAATTLPAPPPGLSPD